MGFDSHIVYILFGIQVPADDKERVFTLLDCKETRPKQRIFDIPSTKYYYIDYDSCVYVYLLSISLGLGENDVPCGHTKITPPTQDEVDQFTNFLSKLDINYPYGQYFLPC